MLRDLERRTENNSAVLCHVPPLRPKNDRTAYDRSVAIGVAELKIAKCRLHSATGRDVDRRDVVRARAVGAG